MCAIYIDLLLESWIALSGIFGISIDAILILSLSKLGWWCSWKKDLVISDYGIKNNYEGMWGKQKEKEEKGEKNYL